MTTTPHFSGGTEEATQRNAARQTALRLVKANRGFGYGVLFSAASYLLRDGQQLRDTAVLAEARRRIKRLDWTIERRKARRARSRPSEDESPFAQIAEESKS